MKHIQGIMLINVEAGSLNNFGNDESSDNKNIMRTKTIKKGTWRNKETYPFITGQALRYWWRNTLVEHFGWKMSPITRDKKIAFTEADPITYPDDDVFGYMRAESKQTITRDSQLKNSTLISTINTTPTVDFGVMNRQSGDPVPFEKEFYSTIFKETFNLNIDEVGVFVNDNRSGYQNLSDDLLKEAEKQGLSHPAENTYIQSKDVRVKRCQDVINSIPLLNGGANTTLQYNNVSPQLIISAFVEGGNNIFMNTIQEETNSNGDKTGKTIIDTEALLETINDYKHLIDGEIYIGIRKGFMDTTKKQLETLAEENPNITIGTVMEVTNKLSERIPEVINDY